MKTHSTNYKNTFIEIADDCPVDKGEIPPLKGNKKTAANLLYEMLNGNPYQYTSDDVLFSVYAQRHEITSDQLAEQRAVFFSKGQPCFRSSPLTKRYGWGIHSNKEGKIAMYAAGSNEYNQFIMNETVVKKKAMRSKRV